MLLYKEGQLDDDDVENSNDFTGEDTPITYKNKSKFFTSLQSNINIWAFVQEVSHDINYIVASQSGPCHLKPYLQRALNKQENNPDLFIKPSEKGGNVVLMKKSQYHHVPKDTC